MQHRHRNNQYDQRSPLRSSYKNFGWHDGNGFGRQPYHWPNPSSRDPTKEEILKKAGKLAAKYLVSKGLLSPSVLERKHEQTGKRFDGDDRGVRRVCHRWGFDDGGDDYKERWQQQGLRDDGVDEDENEVDRGSGEVRWMGKRPWGCYDDWENDDMEREGSYRRKRFRKGPRLWCGRSKEARSQDGTGEKYRWRAGSSRGQKDFCREEDLDVGLKKMGDDTLSYESGEVRDDDLYWYGGNEGERKNNDELLKLSTAEEMMMDGGGGDGSPSNSREEPATGFTIDLNKAANGGSLESGGDEEMRIIDKFPEKSQDSLDMDISDSMEVKREMYEELDGAESHCLSNDDDDVILKLCSFPDVPTKPRIALARRGVTKINKLFLNELNVVGKIIAKIPKADVQRLVMEGLSTNLPKDESNTSRGEDSSVLSIISDKQVEDYANQQHEAIKSSELLVDVNEETQAVGEPMEEPEIKRVSVDEELVTGHVVGQEKPVRDDSSPKFKPKFKTKVEVGKQPQHTFFRVCDLNFMAPREENDADDDLVSDHLNACMPDSEASRDHPVGFGCSSGIVPNKTNIQCLLSRGKMIPLVDLEDDSSTESSDHNSPNSENDTWYFRAAHLSGNGDLHGADGGSSVANPEFHQADNLGYPLLPSEPQTGMGFSVQRFREGRGPSDSAA